MLRQKRLNFWFWVALVALLLNPMVQHLLLSLLQTVLQMIGSHMPV